MKRLKVFEEFELPNRNPEQLMKDIFSDITDEFGDEAKIFIFHNEQGLGFLDYQFKPTYFDVDIRISQILRKSEIEDFINEYLIPGKNRLENEGFEFTPKKQWSQRLLYTRDLIVFKGITAYASRGSTNFIMEFKNEFK